MKYHLEEEHDDKILLECEVKTLGELSEVEICSQLPVRLRPSHQQFGLTTSLSSFWMPAQPLEASF